MLVIDEPLPQLRHFRLKRLQDDRGSFAKTFARSVYAAAGISFDLREEYFSTSAKNVVRGMHFQTPPADHDKIVYLASGAVLDVVLDLRPGPTYGKFCSFTLEAGNPELLFIPRGMAHGFRALEDDSIMVYKTTSEYAPESDRGIRWDSFGFDWGAGEPIVSGRDQTHPVFSDFKTEF